MISLYIGVGMGAWGELFTRYVSPPWSQFFYYRQTHNDYLQFVAESGFIALLALLWLACRLLGRIGRALRSGDPRKWPLFAAILAAVVATGLHELVDFNLHVPANAVLLAVLLGLGLRLATPPTAESDARGWWPVPRPLLAAVAACAIALIASTLGQTDVSYPNFIPPVKTLREAGARVITHPPIRQPLLSRRGRRGRDERAGADGRSEHGGVADPTDPGKRDAYASLLARHGDCRRR